MIIHYLFLLVLRISLYNLSVTKGFTLPNKDLQQIICHIFTATEDVSLHLSQSHLLRTASILIGPNSAELYRVAPRAHSAGCSGQRLWGAPWREAVNCPGLVAAGSSRLQHQCEHPITCQTSAIHNQTRLRKSSSCNGQEKWWRRCCGRHVEGDVVGAWSETRFWKGAMHIRAGTPLRDCGPWVTHPQGRGNKK